MGLSLPAASRNRLRCTPLRAGRRTQVPDRRRQSMILERFKVPAKDQVFVSEAALRRTVTQIFEKLGLSPEDSAEGADVLTMTDLRGVETHGVSNMLRAYVRDYKAGKLDPRPGWRVVRESPSTAVIDAERRLRLMDRPKAKRRAGGEARPGGGRGRAPVQ